MQEKKAVILHIPLHVQYVVQHMNAPLSPAPLHLPQKAAQHKVYMKS